MSLGFTEMVFVIFTLCDSIVLLPVQVGAESYSILGKKVYRLLLSSLTFCGLIILPSLASGTDSRILLFAQTSLYFNSRNNNNVPVIKEPKARWKI